MSIKVIENVWENSPHSGSTLLVQLCMADHANFSNECWPSVARIAAKSRLSERQVQRCISELLKSGQIEFVRHSTGKGETNRYKMLLQMSPVTENRGDICGIDGVTPVSYKPSEEPSLDIEKEVSEEIIYKAYPRHVAKPAALKAIRAAIKRGNKPNRLWGATIKYAEICHSEKKDPSFIPYPATWFNQDRFNDAPDTWSSKKPIKSLKPPADYSNNGGFGETRHLDL